MELVLSELTTALSNILVFCFIPFVWLLLFYRKKNNFFHFIGLNKPKLKSSVLIIGIFIILYIIMYNVDFLTFFADKTSMQALEGNESMQDHVYKGIGIRAIIPGLITNFISNGLCEEILFRGFVLQRLKKFTGVIGAIIIQGLLFGIMHNALYLIAGIQVSPIFHLGLLLSTSLPGIFCGFLNEKIFDGHSIIPSVLLHGSNNFLGTIRMAFFV